METTIVVLNVKVLKDGKPKFFVKETGDIQARGRKDCEDVAHEDLINALAKLKPHLAILSNYVKQKDKDKDKADLSEFTVTGFSIGEKEGNEGVTITGHVKTYRGKTMSLNTPFERFEGEESSRYGLMDDLIDILDEIKDEVIEYLVNGKKAPTPKQGEMDFNDQDKEPVTKLQIVPPKRPDGKKWTAEEYQEEIRKSGGVVADKDPQERVKEMDNDKPRKVRKVAQSADAPSGEVHE